MTLESTESHSSVRRPSLWRTLGRGVLLGALAAFMGIVLLWGSVVAVVFLTGGPPPAGGGGFESFEAALLLLGIATLVVTLIPAMAAGGIDALVLYNVSSTRHVSAVVGSLVGALIGFFSGPLTLLIPELVTNPARSSVGDLVTVVLLAAGTGASIGAWHGWMMARWLRKTRQ